MRLLRATTAVTAVALLALAACAPADDAGTGEPTTGGDAGPVAIEHAFGSTEISEAPERVATWGWGSTEAALAVGVVPVAMAEQTYGAGDDGVLPWVSEELERVGAETPTLLSEGEAPPYEELVEAQPDLILAVYSGITQEQYDLLSEIAPTVAYPDEPWTTPWRDVITTVGEALGRSAEAQDVLDGIDAELAAAAEEHPELDGKTMAAVWDVGGTFYVYKPADARVGFMLDLGLENAPAVDALANGDSSFYYTLSYEQLDQLESDILVSYHDTQQEADAFLQASHIKAIPAVQDGAVAAVVGTEFIAAVSPPTALSLTWGLDELVTSLSSAARATEAA
jgi:iron complex transport system substrate-binding protein